MTGRWWVSLVLSASVALGPAPAVAQSPGASEIPTAAGSPTPSAEPGAGPVGMPWTTTLLVRPDEGRIRPHEVIAWHGGFAMLDGGIAVDVRLSTDGTAWGPTIDAFLPHVGARLAPVGNGLLLVGFHGPELSAWTSKDGRRWRLMARTTPVIGIDTPVNAAIAQAVTVGRRALVVLDVCQLGSCPTRARELQGISRGGPWESLEMAVDGGRIEGVYQGRGRFLAAAHADAGLARLLLASPDGRTWTRVGTLPAGVGSPGLLLGETRAGFVLADPARWDGTGGRILTSNDGATWAEAWTPASGIAPVWSRLDVERDAVLVVGDRMDAPHGGGPVAVTSADGGRTWGLSAGWPSTSNGCFRTGALRGATAVAAGPCGPDARAWVATVPGVVVAAPAVSLTGPIDPADVPFVYGCQGMQFTAADVAEAPSLADVDVEGLETVQGIAARNGWPELDWRRVATKGTRTMAYAADPSGGIATVVFGTGGVLVQAGIGPFCGRAPGFSAIGRVALDPTRPAPTSDSRVLHLQSIGCPDQAAFPARITMLPGHVLLRVSLTGSASEVGCSDTIRFDVRLPRPLGDRRIWNAARLPLKELTR